MDVKEAGRRGGKKGGKAKVKKGLAMLSAQRRKEIAASGGRAKRKAK